MTREQLIVIGFIAGAFVAGWLTSTLVGAVARRRSRDARAAADGQPAPDPRPQVNGHRPLTEEVGDALQNDPANDSMWSVLRAGHDPALSELELDLADWGFTYGVAWARARERTAGASDDEAVAGAALDAARQVFRAYTEGAGWDQRIEERLAEKPDAESGNGPQTAHSPSPRSTL